jgi:hypothetical protein
MKFRQINVNQNGEGNIFGGFLLHQINCAMTFIPLNEASHHGI